MARELKNGLISVLRRHIYVAKCKWKRFNKSDIQSEKTHEVTRCKQAHRLEMGVSGQEYIIINKLNKINTVYN